MSRQHVEFKVPGTDKDSGEEDLTAIKPVADGEPGQAAVFKRPSENLRTRTEFIRDELENLKYLSDADRALLLTSTGSITWNGLPTGTFTASADLTLKPFLAPNASTAARLIICAGTQAQITIRTRQNGVAGQPRAYNGANTISIDFTPVTTGTGAIVVTSDGTPNNNVHVQYDDNAVSGTTVDQIPANSFVQQFNASAVAISLGLEAVVEGTGSPIEVGFPTPPAVVAGSLIKDYISVPEQATRFMAGAADAEKHNITPAHLTTFFSDPLNVLLEGDVVCLRYDELVMAGDGGRRQSIDEFPENKADVAGLNLFILRRFPDRLPGALPVATVVNGTLIFVNGRSFLSGETGPLVAAGASYQGSPAAPNSWADGTVVAGPVSFESALDTIIQTLGTKSGGTPGAIKVGFTPTGNIAANTVKGALEELDSEKAGLALANTFTNLNTFTPGVAGDAITATGNSGGHGAHLYGATGGGSGLVAEGGTGNGSGVLGYGDGTAPGVYGEGGGTSGIGVSGDGGSPNGIGVKGAGTGTGAGVSGVGQATGPGVTGVNSTGVANGVYGTTVAAATTDIFGTMAAVRGQAHASSSAPGVVGIGGAGGGEGRGVYGIGQGTGAGGYFLGGSTDSADGVVATAQAGGTNGGYGVKAEGTLKRSGVKGIGGTTSGNSDTSAITAGVSPVEGPGTGVVGFGSTGSGGGDGVQGFGLSPVGSAAVRAGVRGLGSYSQTTLVNSGPGGTFTGGNATVGNADGGNGVVGYGGTGIGSGTGGVGGVFSGASGVAINASSQRIAFVADPTSAQDAATKNYVDANSGQQFAMQFGSTSASGLSSGADTRLTSNTHASISPAAGIPYNFGTGTNTWYINLNPTTSYGLYRFEGFLKCTISNVASSPQFLNLLFYGATAPLTISSSLSVYSPLGTSFLNNNDNIFIPFSGLHSYRSGGSSNFYFTLRTNTGTCDLLSVTWQYSLTLLKLGAAL